MFADTHKLLTFYLSLIGSIALIIYGYKSLHYLIIRYKTDKIITSIIYLSITSITVILLSKKYCNYYIKINLSFLNKILNDSIEFFSANITINIPRWTLLQFIIIVYLIIRHHKNISTFIKDHILHYFIPYISFISKKLGNKILLLYLDQIGNYHIQCYLGRIKKLKKCFWESALYFLSFLILMLLCFSFVNEIKLISKQFILLLGIFSIGTTLLASKRLDNYYLASPTEFEMKAQNNLFVFFWILSSMLTIIGLIKLFKNIALH